jgi:hypothetical protein
VNSVKRSFPSGASTRGCPLDWHCREGLPQAPAQIVIVTAILRLASRFGLALTGEGPNVGHLNSPHANGCAEPLPCSFQPCSSNESILTDRILTLRKSITTLSAPRELGGRAAP